ncbi:MAG: winged helix DNA-binding domain-containing protein [Promethearchaeota archaeon]
MQSTTLNDINDFVLYKQHLIDYSTSQDLIKVIKDIGGLHATSSTTPYLSLFARTRDFTPEKLDNALYINKSLGKIRGIRKTLYIFPKEIIPIVSIATNNLVLNQSKRALEFRGISSEEYKEISELVLKKIADKGEMTASEIKKALKTEQNISYILYHMCDQKLLIRAKPRKYSLFSTYFPDLELSEWNEQQAIIKLVQHYLNAFGPASQEDIAWWTGLGKITILNALNHFQDKIVYIDISDLNKNLLILQTDTAFLRKKLSFRKSNVNLLPALDPFLMGYKERERLIHSKYYSYVFDRTGNATSTILLNGQVIGIWDILKEKNPIIKLFLFEATEEAILSDILLKAKRIGEFITFKEVLIKICDSMIPLNRKTAGSVMSPLKEC